MKAFKKTLCGLLAASMLLNTGCSALFGTTYYSRARDYDYSKMELIQLEEPEEGQTAAVIHTSMGDITAVLYPEYAPNTVTNFINRANDGYYDNTIIYAIPETVYAITGSSEKDGTDGVTDDGNPIENEYTQNLWPFRGALCSFYTEMGYGDSRYFIVNTMEMTDEDIESMREITNSDDEQLLPDELIDAFVENGGMPTIMGLYTVFGQVVDGWDVFEKIISAECDEETYAPLEEIVISHVEITEYHKE